MPGLDLDRVFDTFGAATSNLEGEITTFSETMNPNNSADLMKLQNLMQKWTMASQTQSNVLKSVGEGMKSTVGNIR
ncbi:MAG: hypothetical protein HQK77_19690 [Desulfobacterales bacterium]|nr:hypothetical protein [Desulfobacterales bacterium]